MIYPAIRCLYTSLLLLLSAGLALAQDVAPPAPAGPPVDFAKEIKPLFEAACIKCHAKGKAKGGFNMESREAILKGGDDGIDIVPGKSAESRIVDLVAGTDPDEVMPKKGTKWTAAQVALLRAWIDQGMPWDGNISFAKPTALNLRPHAVALPEGVEAHPVDRLLGAYFAQHQIAAPGAVDDRTYARRVYLDTIGLLPSPTQLNTFLANNSPSKRGELARSLLSNQRDYADHWLSFWNDLLRNDYAGTGFIDGGRRQISRWLYSALNENLPFDQFVAELINPTTQSEGFSKGIIWRGNVNASMTPPMQAAQNISQTFMGVNIKCASCHDSFINDWALADAYGLAAVYSEQSLELIHCDKPTGKKAVAAFLYPELGVVDENATKPERLRRLAEIITDPKNGRLSRTVVNRLWARLIGRGLVEPLDDMEQPAWSGDLLDWLAEDLVAHNYDLKHTIELIVTSRAYQLPTTESPAPDSKTPYVFTGPFTRRLTAEQFCDALSGLASTWARLPGTLEFDFNDSGKPGNQRTPLWIWTDEPLELAAERTAARAVRQQLEAALKTVTEAQRAAETAEAKGGKAMEAARIAIEKAAAAVTAAQEPIKTVETPGPALKVIPESSRHRVVFRKKFTLTQPPTDAYAALIASQRFDVQVNGTEAKPVMRDGARNGRIVLLDLKSLLVAGENIITVDVSSHTEKQMNDSERKLYPASVTHLNATSGLAFYLQIKSGAGVEEIVSDPSWRVRRNPESGWNTATLAETTWAEARPLPDNVTPIDEGPGLEPITRQDFANLPVALGPQLVPAVSIATHVGKIRASLLVTDSLQSALERPGREQIVTTRSSAATTLQALELTNGSTLDQRIAVTAAKLLPEAIANPSTLPETLYLQLFGRPPAETERAIALEMLGTPATASGVSDLVWALVNLPDFQLIN
ncbi:MAG: hypothetical protein JWL59_496 [Chthoniobacteraceae bacterium]|nr:hypothetical protein [Chthoniobacteraceae bacterium]